MSIIDICSQYLSEGYQLTLRQLYYQLVAKDLIPNDDKVYKKIGSIKDDLVYGGYIDWSTFEDRGRIPHIAYFEDSVQGALQRAKNSYKLDKQLGQPNHIEVWTEKDAISAILKRVTSPLTIMLSVNKGYTSSTAIYKAYKRFCEAILHGQKVKVLYFGDHDASGLDMIRDINKRINHMFCNGNELNNIVQKWWEHEGRDYFEIADLEGYEDLPYLFDKYPDSEKTYDKFEAGQKALYLYENDCFEVVQVGLTLEQIRHYRPPHNPAKMTDPRSKWYIKQFGKRSWEVDALKPNVMQSIVKDKIYSLMDIDILNGVLSDEKSDLDKLSIMLKKINND